jgi:hypothetical protein
MIPEAYETIKQEQGLSDSRLRRVFEQYCGECHACTNKMEWSCKVSHGRVNHNDRFVHVSSTSHKETWLRAGERLLRDLVPVAMQRDLEPILAKVPLHANQLFVGYSGEVSGSPGAERIKLYFSLSGDCKGLWTEAKRRIGRRSLTVSAPTVSGWLLVFVLGPDKPPVFRIDLVYDSIEFRDPAFVDDLGGFLSKEEIDFIGSEARGIVSLREAEAEMLYSYVEFSRPESPLRIMAGRLASALPSFAERLDGLTWIGFPRGTLIENEETSVTLYTKISGPHQLPPPEGVV